MTKINETKKIQKRRTEQEMRNALHCLGGIHPTTDIDDDRIVIRDCIEELLELRAASEEVRGFVMSAYAKMSRR